MTLFWGAARPAKRSVSKTHTTGASFLGSGLHTSSQLKVDFEKANAAAGAGFTGVARRCYTCRAKCNKPKNSGRNGRHWPQGTR